MTRRQQKPREEYQLVILTRWNTIRRYGPKNQTQAIKSLADHYRDAARSPYLQGSEAWLERRILPPWERWEPDDEPEGPAVPDL